MTDKLEFPATVVVDIEYHDSGLWYASSQMMRGLLLCCGHSREECVAKIPGALADFTTICREMDAPPRIIAKPPPADAAAEMEE
jgi:hypothetical protein